MDRTSYKGYDISPAPREQADSGEWSVEFYISCEEDAGLRTMQFFAPNTFPTKEQAIKHCHDFARRIIDHRGDPFDGESGLVEFQP